MSGYPIKSALLVVALVAIGANASAQSGAPESLLPQTVTPAAAAATPNTLGREASFLPAPTPIALLPSAPVPSPIMPTSVGAVSLGAPVESGTLKDINPESIGLMSPNDGGLGNSLWKGTSRALIERLMPAMELPTSSPSLNNLARRFLLTTASVPEGASTANQSFIAMRAEKLVMLGAAADAWKLAMKAKPELMDDITLRLVTEAALVSSVGADVCAKLPDIIKTHTSADWQKSTFVCQIRANDTKAAQLSLDILHTQNVKDDVFFALAEKNILISGKQLPRQLTPLKPLNLALLRQVTLPVRDEVYAHPDAALIPELLKTKPENEKARLDLAERAAERGLIDAASMGDIYKGITFTPDLLTTAAQSKETGARLRALLYQATLAEKDPQNKIVDAIKFTQSTDMAGWGGSMAVLASSWLADIPATADFNASSDQMTLIMVRGGQTNLALSWLKQARLAAATMPNVAASLQNIWPLLVFGGLEADKDFAHDLGAWLDATLKPADVIPGTTTAAPPDMRATHKMAASVLLLLDADGFAVPEEAWAKVIDAPEFEKRTTPSPLLMERLRAAGVNSLRGLSVLNSLIVANGSADIPLTTALPVIRSLHAVGLVTDAANLANEMAAGILQR